MKNKVDLHGQDLTSLYIGIHGSSDPIQELKIIYLVIPSDYNNYIHIFDAYK